MPHPDHIIAEVLRIEGGHADLEGDTGGETFFGISQHARPEYEAAVVAGAPWPPTREGAEVFYGAWLEASGLLDIPGLSDRVAVTAFLFRVHAGQGRMNQVLQIAANAAGEACGIDGRLGPQTRLALSYADQDALYNALRAAIATYYITRPLWPKWGRSWVNHRLRFKA